MSSVLSPHGTQKSDAAKRKFNLGQAWQNSWRSNVNPDIFKNVCIYFLPCLQCHPLLCVTSVVLNVNLDITSHAPYRQQCRKLKTEKAITKGRHSWHVPILCNWNSQRIIGMHRCDNQEATRPCYIKLAKCGYGKKLQSIFFPSMLTGNFWLGLCFEMK